MEGVSAAPVPDFSAVPRVAVGPKVVLTPNEKPFCAV